MNLSLNKEMNTKFITFGHESLNSRWKRRWRRNLEKKVEEHDTTLAVRQEHEGECAHHLQQPTKE